MNKGRILIVEDEAVTAADLHDELVAQGYEVTGTANTAEAALVMAMANPPDLALMDINLAGETDGVFAARALRGKEIAVVFLTAHYDDRTLALAKLTSPVGYITKPFDPRQLGVTIEIGIARHRSDLERIRLTREREHERAEDKTMHKSVPICIHCKRVCDDKGAWRSIESYLADRPDLIVTNSLCPACARRLCDELSPCVNPASNVTT